MRKVGHAHTVPGLESRAWKCCVNDSWHEPPPNVTHHEECCNPALSVALGLLLLGTSGVCVLGLTSVVHSFLPKVWPAPCQGIKLGASPLQKPVSLKPFGLQVPP